MKPTQVRISEAPGSGLDALDYKLLEMLGNDARCSNVELARRTGVSEKTVRNRINGLLARGLKFHAELPRDQQLQFIYLVNSRPGTRFALAEDLRSHSAIKHLHVTNGAADLVAFCHFSDEDETAQFEAEALTQHPNVLTFQVCSSLAELPKTAIESLPSLQNTPNYLNTERITSALVHMPRFRSQPEALHWLASFLRRSYSADRVRVATDFEVVGYPRGLLDPYEASVNLPPDYATMTVSDSRQSDDFYSRLPVVTTLRTRKHVVVPDVSASDLIRPIRDLAAEVGYTALLSFPMNYGTEAVGVSVLYYDKRFVPSEEFLISVQRSLDLFTMMLLNSSGLVDFPAPAA